MAELDRRVDVRARDREIIALMAGLRGAIDLDRLARIAEGSMGHEADSVESVRLAWERIGLAREICRSGMSRITRPIDPASGPGLDTRGRSRSSRR